MMTTRRAEGDGDSEAKGGAFGMSAGPKGKLVQDIMSEMKEDEAAAKQAKEEEDKKGGGGIRMGNRLKKSSARMKGGARLSAEEMHRLRQKIQVLCQATNPLGKCMDYVHDDLAAMNKARALDRRVPPAVRRARQAEKDLRGAVAGPAHGAHGARREAG